ncbi:MAG: polyprenyl diphosphate synthase [Planctomycetota bacterium]
MATPASASSSAFATDVPAADWTAPADILALPPERVPAHIAMIMDGNGRWAQRQGEPRVAGHAVGAKVVPDLVGECCRLRERSIDLGYLTLYSFSLENWKRPPEEVAFLMQMYVQFLRDERPRMMRENVRFNQIGRVENLPQEVLDEVALTLDETSKNDGLVVTLALNYGGRAEIVDAVRALAGKVASGEMSPGEIDEADLDAHLYTGATGNKYGIALPDVDLLVRTAGELRVSNYLLWQISYAEIFVTDTMWPAFDRETLFAALRSYAARERRFGAIDTSLDKSHSSAT